MEQISVKLVFLDTLSCAQFATALEGTEIGARTFDVALPNRALNQDSETLTLLLSFMQNGGLEAIAAFLGLVKEIISQRAPEQSVTVMNGDRTITVTGKLTSAQVKELTHDLSGL
ncbi:hypothetical protein GTP46_26940 [Duganella sp. FT135W]|uniref:Uncharacterized protein n=1 Tax=Duganella flavida TaxID=2692175 RepID=A0A6L8KKE3_9BURK|nr:hypothetical protein [Duganella flavida]MYM26272.1 hypothetical protein [Duganella flavida]